MNLRNLATGADRMFQASNEASGALVTSLLGNAGLELVEYRAQVRKTSTNARKEKVEKEAATVKEMQVNALKATKNRLERIGECGI